MSLRTEINKLLRGLKHLRNIVNSLISTQITQDQKDALDASNNPSDTNPIATINDVNIINLDQGISPHGVQFLAEDIPLLSINVDIKKFDLEAFDIWIQGVEYKFPGAINLISGLVINDFGVAIAITHIDQMFSPGIGWEENIVGDFRVYAKRYTAVTVSQIGFNINDEKKIIVLGVLESDIITTNIINIVNTSWKSNSGSFTELRRSLSHGVTYSQKLIIANSTIPALTFSVNESRLINERLQEFSFPADNTIDGTSWTSNGTGGYTPTIQANLTVNNTTIDDGNGGTTAMSPNSFKAVDVIRINSTGTMHLVESTIMYTQAEYEDIISLPQDFGPLINSTDVVHHAGWLVVKKGDTFFTQILPNIGTGGGGGGISIGAGNTIEMNSIVPTVDGKQFYNNEVRKQFNWDLINQCWVNDNINAFQVDEIIGILEGHIVRGSTTTDNEVSLCEITSRSKLIGVAFKGALNNNICTVNGGSDLVIRMVDAGTIIRGNFVIIDISNQGIGNQTASNGVGVFATVMEEVVSNGLEVLVKCRKIIPEIF